MADRNLPIKLFEKRKTDERRTEGGGSGELPSWVLDMDELSNRSESLISDLEDAIKSFDNRESGYEFIPTTLKVAIDENAIAKSHRNDIRKLFNVNNKSNLIGFSDTNDLLVKVDSKVDASSIEKNIKNYSSNRTALSAIVSIEILRPIVNIDEGRGALKINLLNYRDYELNKAVRRAFINYCESLNLKIRESNYSPELAVFRIEESSKAVVDRLIGFEAIESISFMPKYEISLDSFPDEAQLPVKEPKPNLDYPIVGVLDSGIAKNKYLNPWIVGARHSSYPDDRIDPLHGTSVASIILYGDELEGQVHSGIDGCYIFDATVFPDSKQETIYEDELVENIREAISRNKEKVKIWNLSLGTRKESLPNDFSDFGIALDSIQEIHNVLICKSVGNCDNFIHGRPKSKVSVSADSIRSLVVGSIAHKKNGHDLSEIDHPSPFTRIGYGPANSIKPELVSYGGNAGVNGAGKVTTTGVKAIDPSGQVMTVIGTSFSTPRITGLMAALNFQINETFNPLLLKALAIHSAKYPKSIQMSISDRLKQMGFGLPSPVGEIIYNDPYEITLILQDTLVKGEFMEILEFPFPETMIDPETGCFYGDVKLTLVASPVLREKQGSEYCQSNIDVQFGTYDKLKERDTTKNNILNEVGPDGNKNLLLDGNYKAQFKKEFESEYARERTLINYGRKYQSIKKYAINLEELTPSNTENFLRVPKKWYLKVSGLYRDYAEMMSIVDGEQLSQDFCLIVTIRDNKQKQKVYNEVTQLLSNRNFAHSNIKLRQEVRVNIQ